MALGHVVLVMFHILQMAGRSLESELRTWKQHAQMYVQLANNIVGRTGSQTKLQEHVDSAQKSIIE